MTTTSRPLPRETRTRMQALLDEGDRAWFARNPGEQFRTRMYFSGERVEGDAEPGRYVIVSIEEGRLVRRPSERGDA